MKTSLALALTAFISLAPVIGAEPRVVAYVPNWIDVAAFAEGIDYAKLTHINIAFENPVNDSGDLSFSKQNGGLIAKARANGVKILMSIGGGSASDDRVMKARYFALMSEEKRAGFATKLAEYVVAHELDGLDVDIEGPSINKDYGALIHELALALKPRGKLLTCALSKGYGGEHVPNAALGEFDFVNIMAYDATGPWNAKVPGQHSSLEFAKSSVAYWLGRGLPKSKAVLGVPFYGYGFGAAFKKRDYPYSGILAEFPGAENTDEAGNTVYYNGIPTMRAKARFVADEGLGGVMIWSLDYDVKGGHSLLSTIHGALHLAR